MSDVQFRSDRSIFLLRVAAVARDEDRILLHRSIPDGFWALPGGRVNLGEDTFTALEREIFEESGFAVTARRLVAVIENFWTGPKWPDPEPRQCHEIGFYIEVAVPGEMRQVDHFPGVEGSTQLEFRWLPIAQAKELDLRPTVLRDHLYELDGQVIHLVDRGH